MSTSPPALPRSTGSRLLRSPGGRLAIFFLLLLVFGWVAMGIQNGLGLAYGSMPFRDVTPLVETFRVLPAVIAYVVLVRAVERRRIDELAPSAALPHVALGLLGGAVAFSLVVGALYALGAYVVEGIHHDVAWMGQILVLGVGAGVIEEIVSRGVIFRIVEEGLGTWAALLVSAAIFGGLHGWNPHATVWSAVAIALEAGLLFGLLYHLTRSLWICMGAHAAWNVAQGPFYGIPVSGFAEHGLLASRLQGPEWLTGGLFGAEASVVALAICSAITGVFLAMAMRRGSLVPPPWKRDAKLR